MERAATRAQADELVARIETRGRVHLTDPSEIAVRRIRDAHE